MLAIRSPTALGAVRSSAWLTTLFTLELLRATGVDRSDPSEEINRHERDQADNVDSIIQSRFSRILNMDSMMRWRQYADCVPSG